jgi:DNA primase large subunit
MIEQLKLQGFRNEELNARLEEAVRASPLNSDPDGDVISHFVLRRAFCENEEHRRWFLTQEMALFRTRFETASERERDEFLRDNSFDFELLAPAALTAPGPDNLSIADKFAVVRQVQGGGSSGSGDEEPLYRARIEQNPFEYWDQSRVLLVNGYSIFARRDVVNFVATQLRQLLSADLATTYRASLNQSEDQRVAPLVASLSKRSVGSRFQTTAVSGSVTPDQIPALAERSFPLCMQNMHEHLVQDAHLRYHGRRALGLFLKGIGLSLQDSLDYWRQKFARKKTPDQFNKEYAYNIRYMYGKEGKRQDQSPMSCSAIINGPLPGNDEHHQCPFRSFDPERLRAKLVSRHVSPIDIERVLELVRGGHYQIACQRYFSVTHGNVDAAALGVGNHPNKYFEESKNYHELVAKGAAPPPAQLHEPEFGVRASLGPRASLSASAASASAAMVDEDDGELEASLRDFDPDAAAAAAAAAAASSSSPESRRSGGGGGAAAASPPRRGNADADADADDVAKSAAPASVERADAASAH